MGKKWEMFNWLCPKKKTSHTKVELAAVKEALIKINEGYDELVQQNVIKKSSRIFKKITIGITVIPMVVACLQYIEKNITGEIELKEQSFLFATNSMQSSSEALRSTSIQILFDKVAFEKMVIEPKAGFLSIIQNLYNWITNNKEYLLLERARTTFINFAQSSRKETNSQYNQVSSSLIKVGLKWIAKEKQLFGKDIKDSSLWLFYKAELEKAYTPNQILTNIWFGPTNMRYSYLDNCKFDSSYFENANLAFTHLQGTSFVNTNLRNTDLSYSDMHFAILSYVKADNANFTHANLNGSQLNYGIFHNAVLDSVDFTGANLYHADFEGATMRYVDFSNANLEGANFKDCDLTGANFIQAQNLSKENLKGAILKKAQFK